MAAINLVVGACEPTLSPLQADLEAVVSVGYIGAEAVAEGLQCGEFHARHLRDNITYIDDVARRQLLAVPEHLAKRLSNRKREYMHTLEASDAPPDAYIALQAWWRGGSGVEKRDFEGQVSERRVRGR